MPAPQSAPRLDDLPETAQLESLLDDLMPWVPPAPAAAPARPVVGSLPVARFFAGVNWRNLEPARGTEEAVRPVPGTLKVKDFFAAVNWPNRATAGPSGATPRGPMPTSLDAVLAEFVWE